GLVAFEGVFGAGRTIDSGPQPTEVLRLREVLCSSPPRAAPSASAAPADRRQPKTSYVRR
ncbi:hypothetical protein ACWC1C_25325, partial [Streptomyces sp. NPDC001705]